MKSIKEILNFFPNSFLWFFREIGILLRFILVVIIYVINFLFDNFLKLKIMPFFIKKNFRLWIKKIYTKIMAIIDPDKEGSFNISYLIELAINNMKVKKVRTFVTMGGVAIGISFVVFLVSVGYGLQKMVVSQVASLDELKQADISPGLTNDLVLNDAVIAKIQDIPNVKSVLPLIEVVGKISYQNSVSDMAVYGVTSGYLNNSTIKITNGKFFESNNLASSLIVKSEIATASPKEKKVVSLGDEMGKINYTIDSLAWIKVRKDSSSKSELLGYTRKVKDTQSGNEIIGQYYIDDDNYLLDLSENKVSKWVKTIVPLWKKETCTVESNASCEDGNYLPIMNDENSQKQEEGYLAEISMKLINEDEKVLGVTSDNNLTGSLPIVELEESTNSSEIKKKVVEVSSEAQKLAVVNKSVLQILNINENEAINKKIAISFVVVDGLSDGLEKVESVSTDYTIVGVTSDDGTPMIYVPFIDLRSLGITKYSQFKVIVNNESVLSKVRSTIEASGYGTNSVTDTVAQIDSLFSSFRLILALVGMVALIVAALGMFNTLTISLLERTREVGLMKAMGMKSREVKQLFLTESMIMGFFGGIMGLLLGMLEGHLLSLILTIFSLSKGAGTINISYIPPVFIISVVLLSVFVGILTGYFPAKRSTKISALNALRYE